MTEHDKSRIDAFVQLTALAELQGKPMGEADRILIAPVTITDGRSLSERVHDLQANRDALDHLLGQVLATLRIPANAGKLHGPDFEKLVADWLEQYQALS